MLARFAAYDPSDWAWEFLRRNPDYCAAWRSAVPRRLPHLVLKDGTTLLRLRRRYPHAEPWGLCAFSDPAIGPRQAPVFWSKSAFGRIVRVRAAHIAGRRRGSAIALSSFNVERVAAIGIDCLPLVLMKAPGNHVALEVLDLPALTLPFDPVFELEGLCDLNGQTEALKRLQRFADAPSKEAMRPVFGPDERLAHALIALDESRNNKTYRQIAITIFGESKVSEEWLGPSQFLKDRTRRLVAKGRELMMGGYRDLLCQRAAK